MLPMDRVKSNKASVCEQEGVHSSKAAGKEPSQPRDAKGQSRSHWPAMEHGMSEAKWEKKIFGIQILDE